MDDYEKEFENLKAENKRLSQALQDAAHYLEEGSRVTANILDNALEGKSYELPPEEEFFYVPYKEPISRDPIFYNSEPMIVSQDIADRIKAKLDQN